eukprot:4508282-Prymnesium_polylepis.2
MITDTVRARRGERVYRCYTSAEMYICVLRTTTSAQHAHATTCSFCRQRPRSSVSVGQLNKLAGLGIVTAGACWLVPEHTAGAARCSICQRGELRRSRLCAVRCHVWRHCRAVHGYKRPCCQREIDKAAKKYRSAQRAQRARAGIARCA